MGRFSKKVNFLAIFLSSVLSMSFLWNTETTAITASERKFYGQNNILFYNPDSDNSLLSNSNLCLVDLGDSAATILNFLIGKSYTKNASAGIVGNLMAESGLKTNVLEGGKTVGSDYILYDLTSDKSNYPNRGFGLGQWTTASRQKALQTFANENGLAVTSLEAQLGYLIKELSARGFSASSMSSDSTEEATFKIFDKFEVPGSSFWTTVNGKYYNDYDPKSLSELSEEKTPSAYKAFMKRFTYAKSALAKIDNANLTGNFSSNCEEVKIEGSESDPSKIRSETEPEKTDESGQQEEPEQEPEETQPETEVLISSSSKANAIAELAVSMAWPYSSGSNKGYCKTSSGSLIKWNKDKKPAECSNSLKEENIAVLKSLYSNAKTSRAMDCSWFVADVIKYLGIDKSFPSGGSSSITSYLSKTSKWVEVQNLGNTSNLKPGDVFAIDGHVMFYVGSYGGSYGNAVGASKNSWVARIHTIYYNQYNSGAAFRIFRIKE